MTWWDWLVLAAFLGVSIGIGCYYARQNQTTEDFLLGGRRMSPMLLGLSLFATLVSTLSYLGNPGEMIAHGPMMSLQVLAHPFIFVIVGYGLIPLLMRQPMTSAYEILEQRLGRSIRLAGAAVFLILRFGWMATILYATCSKVLVPMLQLPGGWTPWLCIALGCVAAIYSSFGGIKAVVTTDAVQSLTMLVGAALTLVVITWRMGGVSAWWPTAWPESWQTPSWGFDPQPRVSFGVLLVSTILWYVCTNGSDHMSIQRFLSSRNPSAARKTLAVSQLTDLCVASLLGLTGVAVLGFYQAHAPELTTSLALRTQGDQLFPRFILNEMPTGLAGLIMAAILSAALSSLSSGLNSTCAVIERDLFPAERFAGLAQMDGVRRLRRLTWAAASVAIAVSLLNLLIEGNLIERSFKLVNLLTAPLFVLFFLALFVPRSNTVGAWVGLLASVATAVAIAYAGDFGWSISISFVWMMPCALIVGVTLGSLVSIMTRRQRPDSGF